MSWKQIVSGVAPTLATALGGPLAGTAVKYLAGRLLNDENAGEAELEAALLSASPDQLMELKKIDNDFALEMKKANVDLVKIGAADRQSARDLAKNTNLWPQVTLSLLFVGGYFFIIYFLFNGTITLDQSIRDMANILLGVLTAGIPMILRFWFGGSPQDEAHMDKIYNSVPNRD